MRLDETKCEIGARDRVRREEHHLVADGLHEPPSVLGDHIAGERLEPTDEGVELGPSSCCVSDV